MRVALKIAYDGTRFHGYARQPDVRTVEGEVLRALREARLVDEPHAAQFEGASRTDRGVSAIGNVIAFNSSLRPDAVAGAMNHEANDVWAWAYTEVESDFHPRQAIERWYRYHLLDDLPHLRLREAMALFVGAHDFRSFTSDPPRRFSPIRQVNTLDSRGAIVIDIRAPGFQRGMVRKMVAAGVAYARAEVSLAEIQNALDGRKRDFGMVPPEPLFLMDVTYTVPFQVVRNGKAFDEWQSLARNSDLQLRFSRTLLSRGEEVMFRRRSAEFPGRH